MNDELVVLVAAAVGGLFSLFFEFFPSVSTWFNALTKGQKQLIFGALALLVSGGIFGVNCLGWWEFIFPSIPLTCDGIGAIKMAQVLIAVIGGAQTTHITINKLVELFVRK